MARTYAETPNSTSEVNGSDLLVVQQGNKAGAEGFPQMRKTTIETIKEYILDGITTALVFKGSITWTALQALTGMRVGDMYNVTDREGQNYAWTGTTWDALGETKDLSGIETRLAAEEEKSEELGGKVSDLETAQGQLTSSLTEVSETVEAHDVIIDETSKTASDTKARLHGYDFRKVDRDTLFVLDGDGEASLKQMMDSVEAYAQDAIMLSLEPIIPTASQHSFGIRGQIACDDSYLYVCVAENVWKKIPLQSL